MRRTWLAVIAAAGVAALAAPATASAHGLVQRSNLPIPEWLFGWAAAIVLVLSFVALAALWPKPRLEDRVPWRPLPWGIGRTLGSRPVELLCGAIGVGLFVVVILAGYLGSGTALDNLAPTFILITFWVGMVFAEHPVRGRLPGVQPVARDRAPAAALRGAAPVPGEARPLARRRGAARVHVDRAGVRLGRAARHARDRGARLRAAHDRGPDRLRRRELDALRRDVLRLLQPVRADVGGGDARSRHRPAPAAGRAAGAGSEAGHRRAPFGDDRHRHVRRAHAGPALEGPVGRPHRRGDGHGLLDQLGAADRRQHRPRRLRAAGRRLLSRGHRRRALRRRRPRHGAAAARLRPLAGADRDGLRRRALPDVPAVRGPGDPLPGLGPVQPGLGPVRDRLGGDRLLDPQPERRLVPPGGVRGARATSRR